MRRAGDSGGFRFEAVGVVSGKLPRKRGLTPENLPLSYETVRVRKDGMRIAKYRFNFKFDRQKGDL